MHRDALDRLERAMLRAAREWFEVEFGVEPHAVDLIPKSGRDNERGFQLKAVSPDRQVSVSLRA